MTHIDTDCIVVGGGPAGLVLGLVLARAGVDVVVLEKHADFLRDFRGDTVHPSTQDLLAELGLLEEFLALPHADLPRVTMRYAGNDLVLADLSRLPTRRKAIAFLPQWDFLDLLARAGHETGRFDLRMRTEAAELRFDGDRVAGVDAVGPDGPLTIDARLVVAADGRDSRIRAAAGFTPVSVASPIDVLWFRLPRQPEEAVPFFHGGAGTLICIDRGDFWQIASVLPAGTWTPSEAGLAALRARVSRLEPLFASRLQDLAIDDVHLLRVRLERLQRWYRDGLLVIGDAAHAMSPAGGVGINLAVQDAVAAGRILAPVLAARRPTERDLARVQRRRAWPARLTQAVQRGLQPSLLDEVPDGALPSRLRWLTRLPWLRHAVGRLVGLGARPEHLS
ncbi:FAD-dependent oxidoreductase [Pseudactinotalea sp.]|uniref:FAD-dependent oxidoreductase n=1 Tax=Pseudactinotalea sp. TaxID=1926260 RepID=UPI003B3B41F9